VLVARATALLLALSTLIALSASSCDGPDVTSEEVEELRMLGYPDD
jgi:hypothetical protein